MVILIGLTGGIACGKSAVSTYLNDNNLVLNVIDADQIVRNLQKPGSYCMKKIEKRWPQVVDKKTGELNRAALGEIIFSNPKERRALNGIMNKPIFLAIMKEIFKTWWEDLTHGMCGSARSKNKLSPTSTGEAGQKTKTKPSRVAILDAPTLFETKMFVPLVSNVLVVSCPTELQKERLIRRTNAAGGSTPPMTEKEAEDRIRSQMPLEKKKAMAGYVIENNFVNDLDALAREVDRSVAWMTKQSSWKLHILFGVPLFMGAAGVLLAGGLCVRCFFL